MFLLHPFILAHSKALNLETLQCFKWTGIECFYWWQVYNFVVIFLYILLDACVQSQVCAMQWVILSRDRTIKKTELTDLFQKSYLPTSTQGKSLPPGLWPWKAVSSLLMQFRVHSWLEMPGNQKHKCLSSFSNVPARSSKSYWYVYLVKGHHNTWGLSFSSHLSVSLWDGHKRIESLSPCYRRFFPFFLPVSKWLSQSTLILTAE